MPAGYVKGFTASSVFPAALCVKFTEQQTYLMSATECHDGSSQRRSLVTGVRHSWKLSQRLTPAEVSTLLTFWQLAQQGAFYFYNPKETVPPNTPDPTGVATAGRYVVRFASDWQQSTGLALSDVSTELVEVATAAECDSSSDELPEEPDIAGATPTSVAVYAFVEATVIPWDGVPADEDGNDSTCAGYASMGMADVPGISGPFAWETEGALSFKRGNWSTDFTPSKAGFVATNSVEEMMAQEWFGLLRQSVATAAIAGTNFWGTHEYATGTPHSARPGDPDNLYMSFENVRMQLNFDNGMKLIGAPGGCGSNAGNRDYVDVVGVTPSGGGATIECWHTSGLSNVSSVTFTNWFKWWSLYDSGNSLMKTGTQF